MGEVKQEIITPERVSAQNQYVTSRTKGNIGNMLDTSQNGGQNSSYASTKRSPQSTEPVEAKRSVEVDHQVSKPKAQLRVLPVKGTETTVFHETDSPSNVDASLEKAQKFNIWDHFEKEDEDGKVTCKHCLTKLSHKSNMWKHLRRKHVNLLDPSKKVPRQYKLALCHFDKEGNNFACKHCPKKYSCLKPDGAVKLKPYRTLNYHVRTKHPEVHKNTTDRQQFNTSLNTFPEPKPTLKTEYSYHLEPSTEKSAPAPTNEEGEDILKAIKQLQSDVVGALKLLLARAEAYLKK